MAGMVPDQTQEPISMPTHIMIRNASTVLQMLSKAPAAMSAQEYPHRTATSDATMQDATMGMCGSNPHFTVLKMMITIIKTMGISASHILGSRGFLCSVI